MSQWRWREAVGVRRSVARRRPALRRGGAAGRRGALPGGQPVRRAGPVRRVPDPARGRGRHASPAARCRRWSSGSRPTAPRATAGPITDEWYAHAPSFESSLVGPGAAVEGADRGVEGGVARGHGRIVLLEGESGVGKTRLADEFLRWVVAERGHRAPGPVLRPPGGDSLRAGRRGAAGRARRAGAGRHVARVAGRGGAVGARAPRALSRAAAGARAEAGRGLAAVRGRGAAPRTLAAERPGRDRDRRPAVVRRGQLQPAPLPDPPARACAGALAGRAPRWARSSGTLRPRGSAGCSGPSRTPS